MLFFSKQLFIIPLVIFFIGISLISMADSILRPEVHMEVVPSEKEEEKMSDATDNFIGTEIICRLTKEPPYYDCSKTWNIHLYDTEYPQICNENIAIGLRAKACTKITHFGDEVRSIDIHLGNQHGSKTTEPYPEGPMYQTILYHELQHAICDCTWHSEIANEFL